MAKTVMAFGSFDILHPGHILYLRKASWLGNLLIVVVARDESIRKLKGRNPIFNQRERLEMVGSLSFVHKAVLGNKMDRPEDRFNIIKKYRPDVIALGYDQKPSVAVMKEWLEKKGIRSEVVRITGRRDPKKFKSSIIRRKIDREF